MPKDVHPTTQEKMIVTHTKQHSGPVQVTRSVYINVPGNTAAADSYQIAIFDRRGLSELSGSYQ